MQLRVLTQLRHDSSRRGRGRTRALVVMVAAALLVAMAGIGASATGSLTAPIRFIFHPFRPAPSSNSSFSLTCPPDRQLSLREATRQARFPVYSIRSYERARLTGVTLILPCSNQPHFSPVVQLDYIIDDTKVQLIEGPAEYPGQPLTLTLKGGGRDIYPWKVVTIAGSTYAVSQLPLQDKFGSTKGISGGVWQRESTFFSLNAAESVPCPNKPNCYYNPGMSLQTFTDLVEHLARES